MDSSTQIRHIQERQGRLTEAAAFPRVVSIDTCSFCNLRCSMCVHKEMTRPKGFMPWPLFTKIVDEIAEVDPATRIWMIFFGKPLVAKRRKPTIYEMIDNAGERDELVRFWFERGANVKIPKVSWAGKIDAPNLVTCAVDLDAGYVAGDINTSTLAELWNDQLASLRRLHRQGRFAELPQPCRDWQSARAEHVAAD